MLIKTIILFSHGRRRILYHSVFLYRISHCCVASLQMINSTEFTKIQTDYKCTLFDIYKLQTMVYMNVAITSLNYISIHYMLYNRHSYV